MIKFDCPVTKYTGKKSFAERCMELCPSYSTPIIQDDKIYVEYNGVGSPDVYEFYLVKWVINPNTGKTEYQVLDKKCGHEVIFTCLPDGDYSILLIAAIFDPNPNCPPCIKKYDVCNFDCHGNSIISPTLTIVNPCGVAYNLNQSQSIKHKNSATSYTFFNGGLAIITTDPSPVGFETPTITFTGGSNIMTSDKTATITCVPKSYLLTPVISPSCSGINLVVTVNGTAINPNTNGAYILHYGDVVVISGTKTNYDISVNGVPVYTFTVTEPLPIINVTCIVSNQQLTINAPSCSTAIITYDDGTGVKTYTTGTLVNVGPITITATLQGKVLTIRRTDYSCTLNTCNCTDVNAQCATGAGTTTLIGSVDTGLSTFQIDCIDICQTIDFNNMPTLGRTLKMQLWVGIDTSITLAQQNLILVSDNQSPVLQGLIEHIQGKFISIVYAIDSGSGYEYFSTINTPNTYKKTQDSSFLTTKVYPEMTQSGCFRLYERLIAHSDASDCQQDHFLGRPVSNTTQQNNAKNFASGLSTSHLNYNVNIGDIGMDGSGIRWRDAGGIGNFDYQWGATCDANALDKNTALVYNFNTNQWGTMVYYFTSTNGFSTYDNGIGGVKPIYDSNVFAIHGSTTDNNIVNI